MDRSNIVYDTPIWSYIWRLAVTMPSRDVRFTYLLSDFRASSSQHLKSAISLCVLGKTTTRVTILRLATAWEQNAQVWAVEQVQRRT